MPTGNGGKEWADTRRLNVEEKLNGEEGGV